MSDDGEKKRLPFGGKMRSWKPGESGNPAGKPPGTRNKLQGKFLTVLVEDFDKYGKAAVIRMRNEDPSAYVKVVASLMPKELELIRPLAGLSDDQLIAAIDAINRFIDGQSEVPIPEGTLQAPPETLQ